MLDFKYVLNMAGMRISNPKVVLPVIVSPLQIFIVSIALILSGSRRDPATVAGPGGAVSTFVIKYVCSL